MLIFHSYVSLPEGIYTNKSHSIPLNPIKPPFSYGFPMVFLWFSYGFPMVSSLRHVWGPRLLDTS